MMSTAEQLKDINTAEKKFELSPIIFPTKKI